MLSGCSSRNTQVSVGPALMNSPIFRMCLYKGEPDWLGGPHHGPPSALPAPMPMLPDMLRTRPDQPRRTCGALIVTSAGHLKMFLALAIYTAIRLYLSLVRKAMLVLSGLVVQSSHPSHQPGPIVGSKFPPCASGP